MNPGKLDYCGFYDAEYNIESGAWTESVCTGCDCDYCSERPSVHPKDCKCLQQRFRLADLFSKLKDT